MFEANIKQANLLKKITEAMKDLVTEANIDCTEAGMSLQAMDASHVSLVALVLRKDGFGHFRCDKNKSLGLNMASLGKILKCAGNDDMVTLKSEDDNDSLSLVFESEDQERISDFDLKLMQIDSEHLGIPEQEYSCKVSMPSMEFQRIVRDLAVIGETCEIAVTKEGVKFSVKGDIGNGNIQLKNSGHVDTDKNDDNKVEIAMEEPVTLKFAIRYLNMFTKATPLGKTVTLSMSPDVPVVVEYGIEGIGHIAYYLAPKIDEDE